MNFNELVAVPAPLVTLIGPVLAGFGTVAVICESDKRAKVASLPLNLSEFVPVKCVPAIVTIVPTLPLVGEKEVISGRNRTLKLLELVVEPIGVATPIGPLLAPTGTVVLICVSETTVKVANVLLNVTLVAPVNPAPLIITLAP